MNIHEQTVYHNLNAPELYRPVADPGGDLYKGAKEPPFAQNVRIDFLAIYSHLLMY